MSWDMKMANIMKNEPVFVEFSRFVITLLNCEVFVAESAFIVVLHRSKTTGGQEIYTVRGLEEIPH